MPNASNQSNVSNPPKTSSGNVSQPLIHSTQSSANVPFKIPSQSVPSDLALLGLPNDPSKDPIYRLTQGEPLPGGGDVPDRWDDVQDDPNADIPQGPLPAFLQSKQDAQAQTASTQAKPAAIPNQIYPVLSDFDQGDTNVQSV